MKEASFAGSSLSVARISFVGVRPGRGGVCVVEGRF